MRIRAEDEHNNFTLLRLLLALAVVFGHFQLLDGVGYPPFPFDLADAAVNCFFVVSGFLIAMSYARNRLAAPFYVRRFFRLYPMYACIVLIQTAVLLCLLPNGPFSLPDATIRYLAANLCFANFLHPDLGGVLAGLSVHSINPSLWTIKIEMAFYLCVPLLFIGIDRFGSKFLIFLFAASAVYQAVALHYGDPRLAKQLPGQMQFFAVGMYLYLYARNIRVPSWAAGLIGVAFLAAWTELHPTQPAICPLLTGIFVFCVALCIPPMPIRTDMSYSVYLVHGPLIQTLLVLGLFQRDAVHLIGIVTAVLLLSFMFEHVLERPGNEFGRRLSKRLSRRGAPAIFPVIRSIGG